MFNKLKIEDFNDSFLEDNCEAIISDNNYLDMIVEQLDIQDYRGDEVAYFISFIRNFSLIPLFDDHLNIKKYFYFKRKKVDEKITGYIDLSDYHMDNHEMWLSGYSVKKVRFHVIIKKAKRVPRYEILDI